MQANCTTIMWLILVCTYLGLLIPIRRGTVKNKPVMIQDYNVHMLGVDKLDQLMSYYSFLHKSVKWWRKVFFWVQEVAVINAYIVYKELALKRGERPMSHLAFWQHLIEHL